MFLDRFGTFRHGYNNEKNDGKSSLSARTRDWDCGKNPKQEHCVAARTRKTRVVKSPKHTHEMLKKHDTGRAATSRGAQGLHCSVRIRNRRDAQQKSTKHMRFMNQMDG